MSEEKNIPSDSVDIFDQKLLKKIKEEKIAPKPRWHFLLKNYVIWVVGGLALLVGAGAVSVLTYLMINNDLGIHRALGKTRGEFLLLTLPYFWLVFLGLFIFVIYYNIKHTKRGYRYPLWAVALVSVLASVILGEALFLLGIGEKIDSVLGRRAPFYERFMNPQLEFWSQPEEGRLVGMALQLSGDERFVLIDRDQKEWEVIPASSTVQEFLATMPFLDEATPADIPLPPLRLIGEQISENEFRAETIMSLMPGRAFFDRPGHGPKRPTGLPGGPVPRCLENDEASNDNGDGLGNRDINDNGKDKEKKNIFPCVVTDENPTRSRFPSK
ncbi:MAG: hypothetical protein WC905_00765 [Patescibacteria group bacterium]|jgi:hypothetical protein